MQATTPIGSLTTSASWVASIDGNHPAGRVAADLRVVVEGRRVQPTSSEFSTSGLPPSSVISSASSSGAGAEPGGDLVQQLRALDRGRSLPAALRLSRGGDRRRDLLVRGRGDGCDRLLGGGVLDRQRLAFASDRWPPINSLVSGSSRQRCYRAAVRRARRGMRDFRRWPRNGGSRSTSRTSSTG